MANYTCTEYTSASALVTAINLLETTVTFKVKPYREDGISKFMLISPHPNPGAQGE
ncbi:MAG: hypothetical protein BWY93_01430 [Euryarchaeota archaeon ADurb.BinA087]|nr:MAG: hypothetical protein BWY93_01430 [Euryarchaeota archaeon ADurb.BinA087]